MVRLTDQLNMRIDD